jgi:hypothetical protein
MKSVFIRTENVHIRTFSRDMKQNRNIGTENVRNRTCSRDVRQNVESLFIGPEKFKTEHVLVTWGYWWKFQKERDHKDDLDIGGSVMSTWILKKWDEVDSSVSGKGEVAISWHYGNEPSASTRCWVVLEWLYDSWLLKKNSVSWNELVLRICFNICERTLSGHVPVFLAFRKTEKYSDLALTRLM